MKNNEKIMFAFVLAALAVIACAFIVSDDGDSSANGAATVAKIGDTSYESLTAAWDAALNATGDTTIDLTADSSGNGLQIADGSTFNHKITLNLNGFTYTITGGAVGSTGTVNQAFHLNGAAGSAVIIYGGSAAEAKDGKLVISSVATDIKRFCMNYMNFTLSGVTVDMTAVKGTLAGGISSCEDTLTVTGNTQILIGSGCKAVINNMFGNHTDSNIIFDDKFTGKVDGDICLWNEGTAAANAKGKIEIKAGTFLGVIGKAHTGYNPDHKENGTITVAVSGGSFKDIANAVKYAETNAYLKLADDIGTKSDPNGESINVSEGKTVTLDFNGKTIYSDAKKTINNFGTLTIKDTAATPGGVVNNGADYTIIKNFGQGKLTISDINVVGSADGTTTRIAIKQDDCPAESVSYDKSKATGSITINSGTFTATDQAIQAWGNVTINGGTFNGIVTAITYKGDGAGNITVNGGTFNSNFLCVVWGGAGDWPAANSDSPKITINASNVTLSDGVKLSVGYTSGSSSISELLPDSPSGSGSVPTITVKGSTKSTTDAVASITDSGSTTYYASLTDAIAAATSGKIMLEKDVELNATVTITKNLTLDLNGHNITGKHCRVFHIYGGANVDITGEGTIRNYKVEGQSFGKTDSFNIDKSVIRVGNDSTATDSKLTIGEKVTVSTDCCYGISVFGKAASGELIVKGKVTTTGERAAITGNGSTECNKHPVTITIESGAVVSSTNAETNAIYQSYTGSTTINGTVEGGIEAKAGTVTINSTAKVSSLGKKVDHTPITGDPSTKGYAIAVVNNNGGYGMNVEVIINGGEITGPVAILNDETTDKDKAGAIEIATAYNGDISIAKDSKLVIRKDATFTGKVNGPNNNELVAKGLKAGDKGIEIVGGSLTINGTIISDTTTVGEATITVSGNAITIAGTLDESANVVIDGATTNVVLSDNFANKGTIEVKGSAKIETSGTVTNSGTIKAEDSAKITLNGELTNKGTLELKGSANIETSVGTTSANVVNSGSIVDERTITVDTKVVPLDSEKSSGKTTVKDTASAAEYKKAYTEIKTAIYVTATIENIAPQIYTGSAIEPAVITFKDASGNVVSLTKGTDYEVTYADNTDVGTATVKVTSKGDTYGFTAAVKTFTIYKDETTKGTITVSGTSYKFTDSITTTGELSIAFTGGTITFPAGTAIPAGTAVSVDLMSKTQNSLTYEITTAGYTGSFVMKLPCTGMSGKLSVTCSDPTAVITNAKYNSSEGYVTFTTNHNSTFVISFEKSAGTRIVDTGSSSSASDSGDYGAIIALLMLAVSLGFLAFILKRN